MNKKIIIVVAVIFVGFVGFKFLSKNDYEKENNQFDRPITKEEKKQNNNLDIYPGLIKDKSKSETNK